MGVRNYQIDGVSCSGKTSVCDELVRRGYHAVHGDRELAYLGDPKTGRPLESTAFDHWIWDLEGLRVVLSDHTHEISFLCGGCRNSDRFRALLDGVFVLEIDRGTLERRLAARPAEQWSGSATDGVAGARLQHATRRGLAKNGVSIDATLPVSEVVDAILLACGLQPPDVS